MTPLVIIFSPFVRLLSHSLAASFGFSGIAVIAIVPIQVIKWVSSEFSAQAIFVLEFVESSVLYLDAVLFLFVIAIYSVYFVFEQSRALWMLFKSEMRASEVATAPQGGHPTQAGGAVSP